MRAAILVLLALLLPAAHAAPADLVPECNVGVCVEVDSFNGDCGTFHMEFVRILVPGQGIVIHTNRWCGSNFAGMRADVVLGPTGTYSGFVWYQSGTECNTYVWTEAIEDAEAYGCPAGPPPALPPVIGLLP